MRPDKVDTQSTDPNRIFKPSFVTPRTPPPTRALNGYTQVDTALSEPKDRVSELTEPRPCDGAGSQLEEPRLSSEREDGLETTTQKEDGLETTTQKEDGPEKDYLTTSSIMSTPLLYSGTADYPTKSPDLEGNLAGMGF